MVQMFRNRALRSLALVLSLALLAAACGDGTSVLDEVTTSSTDDSTRADSGGTDPGTSGAALADLAGAVLVSGSSTVEPISIRVAELFERVAPGVVVDVDGPGTGDGFKLFCAGETDISNASRQIKGKEVADCEAAGIEFIELRVAIDGIAVMTNEANDVDCLSFPDLYALIGPESTGFKTWADANDLAAEVGGDGGFADVPLDLTAPGEESGTYDSFVEIVLEHFGEARAEEGLISEDEAATTRPDYSSSADDNVILQNIVGSPSGLGWVGFAFGANASGVKLVDITEEAGGECVEATEATIASGEYPISRALYVYVNKARAESNPAVQGYVDYYVEEGLEGAVGEVGYVTLGADGLAATRSVWATGAVGVGSAAAPAAAAGAASDTDLSAVVGNVLVSGSSTVEPISIRVAELFESVAPGVVVDVDGPGTGDGFKLFCSGETDISNASRQIKGKEADDCEAAGIDFTELRVAIDGIAVLTNPANDVDCLSFADLYSLVGAESIGFSSWADANDLATEVGGSGGFPDAALDLTAPGEESGTYDSFIEIVLEDIGEARAEEGLIGEDEAARTRPDYSSSADDNVILQNVVGSPSSLGWVGFAFAANADDAKLVDIAEETGGECVSPTEETIASGEYPISRALYIYVNNANAAENPALQAYVDYYVNEGLEGPVAEVGYVTLNADALAETRGAWG